MSTGVPASTVSGAPGAAEAATGARATARALVGEQGAEQLLEIHVGPWITAGVVHLRVERWLGGRGSRALRRGVNPVGWMASIRYVPSSQNRSHGSTLGAKLRRFCDGQKFRYVFF